MSNGNSASGVVRKRRIERIKRKSKARKGKK